MKRILSLTVVLFCAARILAQEKFALASPLQSGMVVQQSKPFKIWGTAPAGATINVQADWMQNPAQVIADKSNKFLSIIPVPDAKSGDFTKHSITLSADAATVRMENLLIGDVWICSGQSNMQFGMRETIDSAMELPKADYPNIRLFNGGLNFSAEPVDSISGKWQECTPKTAHNFSAVAYHFGRELHQALNIPVGIIFTGIGASAAQAYVPQDVLAADTMLNRVYLQPYLNSSKSKEKIDGGFTFEKVTRPFLLYNAIIHPFANLSIKGFTWYQGESNRMERESYTRLTQAMIQSWRRAFAQGNLPFYYVQVAPFWWDKEDSTLADYAFFREAQEKIALLNNTAMVSTMDVGEAKDLHPKNKKPIGVRLAKTALNQTYGMMDVAYQGPLFHHAEYAKNKVTIQFEPQSVRSGLATADGKVPRYFFVAGKDKKFVAATATIQGNTIVLSCPQVAQPVAVRYAFTNYPVTNLQNKDGFPPLPFRTDDWPEELPSN